MKTELTKKEQKEQALSSISDPVLKQFTTDLWDFSCSVEIKNQSVKKFNAMITFCEKIKDLTIKDIDWEYLCAVVDENVALGFQCMKLLHYLLSENLYEGSYKEQLTRISLCFDISKIGIQERYYKRYFVYDEIKYVFYLRGAISRRIFFIRTDNTFLFSVFSDFCVFDMHAIKTSKDIESRNWFWYNIKNIMGEYESSIKSMSDFNYSVFKYMEDYCLYSPQPEQSLRKLYRLFSFLIEKTAGTDLEIFKSHDPIDYYTIKRDDLAKRKLEGYQYFYYNPYDSVPAGDRWMLSINGFDRGSTKLKATASKLFDFSRIDSLFYRTLAKEYFWNEKRCNFNTKYEHFLALIDPLNRISLMKKKYGESEKRITINETSNIRMWLNNLSVSVAQKNQKITILRKFLSDLQKEEKISIEDFALDYLKQYGKY